MRALFVLPVVLGSLLLVGAGGATAPRARTLTTAGPVTLLAADGPLAAAVVRGDGRSRCTQVVLWQPGTRAVSVKTQVGCGAGGALEGVDALALGGRRVLWEETNGGNNLELIVNTATVAAPKSVGVSYAENGNGAAGNPGGDYTGALYADKSLLVFASWTQCDPYATQGSTYARPCEQGKPQYYNGIIHRVVGGKDSVLRSGDDILFPVWVDGGRILVHNGPTLTLLSTTGGTLRTFDVGQDVLGSAFQGSRLVVLRSAGLDVYDTTNGVHTHSFRLVPATRRLVDVQSGIAVLIAGPVVRLIQLDTGRGTGYVPKGGGTIQAQLEPNGLFMSSARGISFVPMAQVVVRLH